MWLETGMNFLHNIIGIIVFLFLAFLVGKGFISKRIPVGFCPDQKPPNITGGPSCWGTENGAKTSGKQNNIKQTIFGDLNLQQWRMVLNLSYLVMRLSLFTGNPQGLSLCLLCELPIPGHPVLLGSPLPCGPHRPRVRQRWSLAGLGPEWRWAQDPMHSHHAERSPATTGFFGGGWSTVELKLWDVGISIEWYDVKFCDLKSVFWNIWDSDIFMICRNIYIYIHGIVRCYILFNTSNKWGFADLNDWQIAFTRYVDGVLSNAGKP